MDIKDFCKEVTCTMIDNTLYLCKGDLTVQEYMFFKYNDFITPLGEALTIVINNCIGFI